MGSREQRESVNYWGSDGGNRTGILGQGNYLKDGFLRGIEADHSRICRKLEFPVSLLSIQTTFKNSILLLLLVDTVETWESRFSTVANCSWRLGILERIGDQVLIYIAQGVYP